MPKTKEDDYVIVRIDIARHALAEAKTMQQAKRIADMAEAARVYAQRLGLSIETINYAMHIRLLAERLLGEMLAATKKAGQFAKGGAEKGVGRRGNNAVVNHDSIVRLSELGISRDESSRAQRFADIPTEQFEQKLNEVSKRGGLVCGADLLRDVKAEAKTKAKTKLAAKLNAQPLPSPTEKFDVIVIDPPWRYHNRAEDNSHRARNPYPDMTVEEIAKLPVLDRANSNSILWLWTTNAFLVDAFNLVSGWSFEYKTLLTWAKSRMGTGDWLRGQTEHCLFAICGKPLVTLTNQTTLLTAPLREHSRKPAEFFELVESLCPGTRLEMFGREKRKGWQVWGAEIEKF